MNFLNGKSINKWHNQKLKYIKRMDDNCHIPDLVQEFSYVENCGFNAYAPPVIAYPNS